MSAITNLLVTEIELPGAGRDEYNVRKIHAPDAEKPYWKIDMADGTCMVLSPAVPVILHGTTFEEEAEIPERTD